MTLRVTPAEIVDQAEASGRPGLLVKAPHWPRVRLGDVATVVNGAAFASRYFNVDGAGMPLVRIRDVGSSRIGTWYSGPWEQRYRVRRGDILIGMDGDFRIAPWTSEDGLLNQRVCRVDVDGSRYNARFLLLVLQGYLDAIHEATSSTTVKHLSSRTVADIPLPRPELEEQGRIVDLLEGHLSRLDAADAGMEQSSRRLIAYRRESVQQAVSAHSLSDVPLRSLIDRVEAGKSFGGSAPPASGEDWGLIKVSAMTWGEFRPQENKTVPADLINPAYEIHPGDILVSRANTTAYVGAPVLVRTTPRRRLLSDKSLRLTPRDGIDREWLVAVLSAPSTRRQISAVATGTSDSMRNISQGNLLAVRVPWIAPEKQRKVVHHLGEIMVAGDRLEYELQSGRKRSAILRRALLGAAFSGQLTGRSSDAQVVEELDWVASRSPIFSL